jgi:hypothetical protein
MGIRYIISCKLYEPCSYTFVTVGVPVMLRDCDAQRDEYDDICISYCNPDCISAWASFPQTRRIPGPAVYPTPTQTHHPA